MSVPAETPVAAAAEAPPRPVAFFLRAPQRMLGPLTRDELEGYFSAGLVGADAMIIGPDWDGAVSADVAAERFGVARRAPAPATPAAVAAPRAAASLPPLPPAPIAYRRAGIGWRAAALWATALLAVQMAIVPALALGAKPGLGGFVTAVAWRYALVAVPCLVLVGGLLRLARGHWSSPRGPLLAMSAIYAVLAAHFLLVPAPTVAIEPPRAAVVDASPAPQATAAPVQAAAEFTGFETQSTADPVAPAAAAPQAAAQADPAATALVVATPAPPRRAYVDPDPSHTQAHALFEAGDWQALLAHATAWTAQSPRNKHAWLYLGLANERLYRRAAAVAANEQAHALDPEDLLIARNLANTYVDMGDYRRGADLLEHILKRTPDSHRVLNDYGFALSRLGEYDESVEALERAVKINPGYALAWRNLMNTHIAAGHVDRAKDAARRANGER